MSELLLLLFGSKKWKIMEIVLLCSLFKRNSCSNNFFQTIEVTFYSHKISQFQVQNTQCAQNLQRMIYPFLYFIFFFFYRYSTRTCLRMLVNIKTICNNYLDCKLQRKLHFTTLRRLHTVFNLHKMKRRIIYYFTETKLWTKRWYIPNGTELFWPLLSFYEDPVIYARWSVKWRV